MEIKFAHMAHKLFEYKKIVLYGTGNMAKEVYIALRELNISVCCCVVTEKQSDYFMENIPVYEIKEYHYNLNNKDTIILIAVSKLYEIEIENILKINKIYNYLRLSDFVIESLLEEYRNKLVEECIEEIVEWKIVKLKENWEHFTKIKEDLKNTIESKVIETDKIVFVIGDLTPRVLKIMKSLQNKGIQIVVLFYPNALIRDVCLEEFQKLKVLYIENKCIEELIYSIILEQVKVVHIFSNGTNTIVPYVLIKMRKILPCLVYDEYDILNEFYYNYPEDWLEAEKFCLENADGICNRGFELDCLKNDYNYIFKGKTLQFFDYCRDDILEEYSKEEENSLTICYAGGVITEKQYPNSPVCCWLELAQRCKEAKCHLHIYPIVWSKEIYKEYIELEQNNEFFHFHHPVSSEKLKQELSKYDYGIHPVKSGFLEQEIIAYNTVNKEIYGVANHFFDYLDAGLPIIAADPVLFAKSFEEKGILLPWTIEQYNFDELRKNKKMYKERVKIVHKKFQIKNHISKLIDFYNNL